MKNIETQSPKASSRLVELDWLKFVALGLMVFTHVCMYFYTYNSPVGNFFSDLGGTVCFTLFLVAYGSTLPVLSNKYSNSELTTKLLKRAGVFYLLYVLIGVLFTGPTALMDILLLRITPVFANFLLAFAYFFLVSIIVVRLKTKRQIAYLVAFSIAAYFLSQLLYSVAVTGILAPYKALLVGQADLAFFPIAQYLIVLTLGVLIGKYSSTLLSVRYLVGATSISGLLVLILNGTSFDRWQVAPLFLVVGLFFVFSSLLIWNLLISKIKVIHKIIFAMSKRTSAITVNHLLIIFLLTLIPVGRYSDLSLVALYLFVLGLSAVVKLK